MNFSSKDVQGKATFPKGPWSGSQNPAVQQNDPVPVAVLFRDSFSVHSKLMRRHQICGVHEWVDMIPTAPIDEAKPQPWELLQACSAEREHFVKLDSRSFFAT